jgi:hypothetical protein
MGCNPSRSLFGGSTHKGFVGAWLG